MVALQIGAAVLAAWALLAFGRAWRHHLGWVDWVGQGLGIVWVVLIPVNLIVPFWFLL
jgi:hypothetical protein